MSTGGWIGAVVGLVVGAVVGFIIGGAPGAVTGALYGAALGFAAGMWIDPMTPDIPSSVAPLPAGAEVMTTVVGDPLPDLLGTAKVTGHLLCFGKERTETVYAESGGGGKGGGGGSPDPQVSGYEYYMSWAVGIAAGPINTLYAVYKNNDVVWEGEINLPTDSDSFGQETIILEGMGSAIFYFGTDDQVANSDIGDIIGDDTLNSPYRHFCWCFFDDCFIGDYNRCPTMKFILRKSPVVAFSDVGTIQTYDYNPMHAIWYILHDLVGFPEDWLDFDDFASAALTLTSENRGISCLFSSQQSAISYLENINGHIDGIIRYGADGKFHPKLIRDDYIVDDLPLIDENVMLDDPTLKRKSWIDTVNEVKVQYTEILGVTIEFPQGPWKAAMSPSHSSFIYVYDITYKSVIKLNTSMFPVVCQDALVITEHDLDYDMGYGNPGSQRGGYCMNPGGDRLWYLVRDGLDCDLIEVDISGYYIKIVNTTTLSSLLVVGEKINDACSDDIYTYWCTTLVAGRVIKIRNSDHSIVLDTTFNYPIVGTGCTDSPIESIATKDDKLYWIYDRDHMGYIPEYNSCRHWIRSDKGLSQEIDQIYCGSGFSAPYDQNLIRCFGSNIFVHRSYYTLCCAMSLTDTSLMVGTAACKLFLLNIMGVEDNMVFILTYDPPYTTYLKCLTLSNLGDILSIDVSEYTGHSLHDNCIWSGTSALSNYGLSKILSLFTYDEVNNVNRVTCFSANESLSKLAEGEVRSKKRIEYGD